MALDTFYPRVNAVGEIPQPVNLINTKSELGRGISFIDECCDDVALNYIVAVRQLPKKYVYQIIIKK